MSVEALACKLDIDVWTFDESFRDRVNQNPKLAGKAKLVGVDVFR